MLPWVENYVGLILDPFYTVYSLCCCNSQTAHPDGSAIPDASLPYLSNEETHHMSSSNKPATNIIKCF